MNGVEQLEILQSERSCNMWISASKKAIQPSNVGIKFGKFRRVQSSHRGEMLNLSLHGDVASRVVI